MIHQIKFIVFGLLPLFIYVPLVIGSRVFFGLGAVPPWIDWVFLLSSASLIAINPLLKNIVSLWLRGVAFVIGFALWSIILFFVGFYVMALVFSDAL